MSTSPNQEQAKAIEHNGGVLLSAGAGSGKTFVLKEHLIYLSENWISEAKSTGEPLDSFEIRIKNNMRKIVMMTFTKKAAGELQIRIEKEFLGKTKSDHNQNYWNLIYKNIHQLSITTIHGFCFKVIRMGILKGVASDLTVLSDSEYKEAFQLIFEDALEKVTSNLEDTEISNILIKEKKGVYQSLEKIFSEPGLRNLWCHELDQVGKNDQEICSYLLEELEIDWLKKEKNRLSEGDKFDGKKWWIFINEFIDKLSRVELDDNGFRELFKFFHELNFKIPVKPSAKTFDIETISYYEKIIAIKDFFKKNADDIEKYFLNIEGQISLWFTSIHEIVKKMNDNYYKIPGVTFSDLEYIVFNALKDETNSVLVKKEFDYFIVDEFQDTSLIQFSIIEKLTKNDFSNFFCVGDLKQAIYGFRGGELGVFKKCEKLVPLNLSLKNNYRSDRKIIDFNNKLFSFIFERGFKYEGHDKHGVHVEFQNPPDEKKEMGYIRRRMAKLDKEVLSIEALSNTQIESLEAQVIFDEILYLKESSEGNIAILYKKLRPSLKLISLLMENNIGFTAQVKVPFKHDPIIGIYYTLLEKDFNKNKNTDLYCKFIIDNYLKILGCPEIENLAIKIKAFHKKRCFYGLFHSFNSFLDEVGIVNSNFTNNLLYLESLEQTCNGEPQKIFKILSELDNESYSYDFRFGENAENVIIMTAHASKGLQFKNVILGGVHTNDGSQNDLSLLGKLPYSFKWTEGLVGKNRYKTLTFIYENILTKQKDFSEHKRLFYVACTRAESSLSWVDFEYSEVKRKKESYQSWAQGINTWLTEDPEASKIVEDIPYNSKNFDKNTDEDKKTLPIFHTDSLGINFTNYDKPFSYLPELSVTRLTSLIECPKKFYLQNICMLTQEEIDLIKIPEESAKEISREIKVGVISSAGRGTIIHDKLAQIIDSAFESNLYKEILQEFPTIKWTVDKLQTYVENYKYISEKPIKFEFYGYMISGIPDLILESNDSSQLVEIWDFKTGMQSQDKDNLYFFQVFIYAYALYNSKRVEGTKQIKLVLNYVDEEKIVDKIVSLDNVQKYLSEILLNLNTPENENLDHCPSCLYKNLCKK